MWNVVLTGFLTSLFLSASIGAPEIHCPPWGNESQGHITQAQMPERLEQILKHHKGNGLFAKFEEEKKILLLQRPLYSSGELIFLPQKGLYRKLNTPFQQESLITLSAIYQRHHQGAIEMLDLEKFPPAKALINGLLTVFSGSLESIEKDFRVYFSLENDQWTLGLQPHNAMISRVIACIILEGVKNEVLRFWVRESNGDITRDQLLDPQILTPERWQDYQRHFDWGHATGP